MDKKITEVLGQSMLLYSNTTDEYAVWFSDVNDLLAHQRKVDEKRAEISHTLKSLQDRVRRARL